MTPSSGICARCSPTRDSSSATDVVVGCKVHNELPCKWPPVKLERSLLDVWDLCEQCGAEIRVGSGWAPLETDPPRMDFRLRPSGRDRGSQISRALTASPGSRSLPSSASRQPCPSVCHTDLRPHALSSLSHRPTPRPRGSTLLLHNERAARGPPATVADVA